MAVNVPAPTYTGNLGALFVSLRNNFAAIAYANRYVASMGGATFLEAAQPNGLGMASADAAALIATLGNLTALAVQYNGGAQAPVLDYGSNSEPFWGGN